MKKYRKTLLVLIVVSLLTVILALTSSMLVYRTCSELANALEKVDLSDKASVEAFTRLWEGKSSTLYVFLDHQVIREIDDFICSMTTYCNSNILEHAEERRQQAVCALWDISFFDLPVLRMLL